MALNIIIEQDIHLFNQPIINLMMLSDIQLDNSSSENSSFKTITSSGGTLCEGKISLADSKQDFFVFNKTNQTKTQEV